MPFDRIPTNSHSLRPLPTATPPVHYARALRTSTTHYARALHAGTTRGHCAQSPASRSLWRLEVAVDDLAAVKVAHAAGDLSRPAEQQRRRQVLRLAHHLVQLAVRTVLHHDAVARRLRAHAPGGRTTNCSDDTKKTPDKIWEHSGTFWQGGGGFRTFSRTLLQPKAAFEFLTVLTPFIFWLFFFLFFRFLITITGLQNFKNIQEHSAQKLQIQEHSRVLEWNHKIQQRSRLSASCMNTGDDALAFDRGAETNVAP